MNILFLTDSLGYPRVDGAQTKASDTWTYSTRDLLETNDSSYSCFFDMKPMRTSSSLLDEIRSHILSYEPDVIVLQIGIVDCYPRSLTRFESQVLSRIPILKNVSKYFVKKFYRQLIKIRKISYTTKEEFNNNLQEIKSYFPNAQWLVIPIAPASDEYKEINPLVESNIDNYNQILKDNFFEDFLEDLFKQKHDQSIFLDDNHHLSKYGHTLVRNYITQEILKLRTQNPE